MQILSAGTLPRAPGIVLNTDTAEYMVTMLNFSALPEH